MRYVRQELASTKLTRGRVGTLIPIFTACVPTVTDNAFTEGLIPAHMFGISLEPTTTLNNTNGELTLGGMDTSKFTGPLNFVYVSFNAAALRQAI